MAIGAAIEVFKFNEDGPFSKWFCWAAATAAELLRGCGSDIRPGDVRLTTELGDGHIIVALLLELVILLFVTSDVGAADEEEEEAAGAAAAATVAEIGCPIIPELCCVGPGCKFPPPTEFATDV